MAIGRSFSEALMKALRSLERKEAIFSWPAVTAVELEQLMQAMRIPTEYRLQQVQKALWAGASIDQVFAATKIDPWYLRQIELINAQAAVIAQPGELSSDVLRTAKSQGFSDSQIALLRGVNEDEVRKARHHLGIRPVYKTVDTCAAEFEAFTPYHYSSYEEETEIRSRTTPAVIILGSGPNRIGQGIEFDYCCVHAALALREDGYETIMVNCNPETVSTDYDTSDRLYFEPLTLEDVLEIVHKEKPVGIIVQYGGQTPLKLARALEANGAPIIGTSPESIDVAEDRERFQKLLNKLNLRQPPNRTARTESEALNHAQEIGYPLVVRPSYVLGGRAMEIVHEQNDLERYMREAVKVSNDSPVLLDRFLNNAIEIDVDCLCDGQEVFIGGVMEHIEQAGVHSGDSACCLPPYSLSPEMTEELKRQTALMARALNVKGLMNVQFAVQNGDVYVLEVNPRASRTVPFVSKATGLQLAKIAARAMAGQTLASQGITKEVVPHYFSVK
jgi:carbamoyl-phosphate synthase large subunit